VDGGRAEWEDVVSAPALLDRAAVREHFGLTRVDTDRVFSRLALVRLPDSRKVYVRRGDLEAYIGRHVQERVA
jgi:hypothetical protein